MLAIGKGPEPQALAAYRAVPGATYDGRLPELCCVLRLWARKRYGAAW